MGVVWVWYGCGMGVVCGWCVVGVWLVCGWCLVGVWLVCDCILEHIAVLIYSGLLVACLICLKLGDATQLNLPQTILMLNAHTHTHALGLLRSLWGCARALERRCTEDL